MKDFVRNCRYIFIDIVGYSKNRSVEAQVDVIKTLNVIVKAVLSQYKLGTQQRVLLPTGDGMCICLLDSCLKYDSHLAIALSLLEQIEKSNRTINDDMRKFKIRIGLNENIDNVVVDINNRKNVAGSGINIAQRIMDHADESMILVGSTVFEKLSNREAYIGSFIAYSTKIKHGNLITVYQYVNNNLNYLTRFKQLEISIHCPDCK